MSQYTKELDALERAIAEEREKQLVKMKQKLIKKKIEVEKAKKEELLKDKMAQVKNKVRAHLREVIAHGKDSGVKSTFAKELKSPN